jgi:hypothetical protein
LKDFNFKLAIALIESAEDIYFQNGFFADGNRAAAMQINNNRIAINLGFQQDPTTLAEWLQNETWPKRHRLFAFSKRNNFVELRFTNNQQFSHGLVKCGIEGQRQKRKKNHCAFCVMGRTSYMCGACKVPLCRVPKQAEGRAVDCFHLWHNVVDLVAEQKRQVAALKRQLTFRRQAQHRAQSEESTGEEEEEVEENEDEREGGQDESPIGIPGRRTAGPFDINQMANNSYQQRVSRNNLSQSINSDEQKEEHNDEYNDSDEFSDTTNTESTTTEFEV